MDLQDASPLEVANQVAAKVKQHARPWRAIIAFVLAVGAASVSVDQHVRLRNLLQSGRHAPPVASRIVWLSTTVAFVVFAVITVIEIAAKTRQVLSPRTGTAHAAVVRYVILLIGAVIVFISILALLKIPVTQLLVGGAVTTIFIGIAAQQSLGNVFAGIVLIFSRPFQVGDVIVLRSGSLGGLLTGTVTEIGLTYLRLDTGDGVMHLPNSQVLAAGVGQIRPPAPELPPSPEAPGINVPGATPPGGGAAGAPGGAPANGRQSGPAGPGTAPSGAPATAPGAAAATPAPAPGAAPPDAGAPSGEAPGSGGRPLSPPGL